MAQIDC
jgi:hypothetical protein